MQQEADDTIFIKSYEWEAKPERMELCLDQDHWWRERICIEMRDCIWL
jgi:hypothetical protein